MCWSNWGVNETFQKFRSIYEVTLGKDHVNTAISHNNIGGLILYYKRQQDYKGATQQYRKTLDIYEKSKHQPDVQNIANLYGNIGDATMNDETDIIPRSP